MKRLVTGKSALATAVGALLGGLVAGPWGIALGAAGGAAISVAPRRHKSAMTPARAIEYEKAITTIKDPTEPVPAVRA